MKTSRKLVDNGMKEPRILRYLPVGTDASVIQAATVYWLKIIFIICIFDESNFQIANTSSAIAMN